MSFIYNKVMENKSVARFYLKMIDSRLDIKFNKEENGFWIFDTNSGKHQRNRFSGDVEVFFEKDKEAQWVGTPPFEVSSEIDYTFQKQITYLQDFKQSIISFSQELEKVNTKKSPYGNWEYPLIS